MELNIYRLSKSVYILNPSDDSDNTVLISFYYRTV